MSMVGRTYVWHGETVRVLAQWRTGQPRAETGPQNVLILRPCGRRDVVPKRALRLPR